ncbi:MAG: glycosyltransferase family 2 protein [Yoonia sp.]
MADPRILTIVLNYKTAQMTLEAADAARVAMQGLPGEIVIVDNDSQDGSFETMAAHVASAGWDNTRVIQSGHNGGFGAGNNVGIRAGLSDGSRPDYVYILNSDAFPKPDAIRVLYDHLNATPGTGFAGSFIAGEDGVQHTTTFRFPSIWSELEGSIHFGPVSKLLKSYRVPRELTDTAPVDWLAGASMMIRQDVLDEIGLFDETFFLYFEETDLCRRAQKAGHQGMFLADSVVTHLGSVSTGMKEWQRVPDYWFDSRWYYFAKNHGRAYAICATILHLTGGSLHWLRCKLTGKRSGAAPHFLRTMAAHDFAAVFKPTRARPDQGRPQTGEE